MHKFRMNLDITLWNFLHRIYDTKVPIAHEKKKTSAKTCIIHLDYNKATDEVHFPFSN